MNVYVLIGWYDHEGHSEPEGVYSTRQLAEAAQTMIPPADRQKYDGIDILEYPMDQAPDLRQRDGLLFDMVYARAQELDPK